MASSYNVTFYSDGVEAGRWETDRYTSGDSKLYFYLPGITEPYVLGGTYVLEPKPDTLDPSEEVVRAAARYKVSLFSGGSVVRTFLVERFTSGDGKLYLYPLLGRPATIISGTFIVEPIAPPGSSQDVARFTVSLYSGPRPVRTWEVTRYTSGSGKIYLYVPGNREPIVVSGSFTVKPK
jgi:hypothetical protein